MNRYVIETRLTYDHGGTIGMHCNYPCGLFSIVDQQQRVEIDRGQNPIYITMDWMSGWALITDLVGCPMSKIRQPEIVAPYYDEHEFYNYGKLYILEIRLHSIQQL